MDTADRVLTEAVRSALADYLAQRQQRDAGGISIPIPVPHRPRDSVWLTVEEAVSYLGLRSRMALYQAVRRGQIPVHHLGRRLRFRRSELDERLSRTSRR